MMQWAAFVPAALVVAATPGANRLVLLRPNSRVFRVFEICGMADRLPFAD
jgi:hypothetical protein